METLRLDAVAARVVAWHNKHPLARRIKASQVQSAGVVALPYLQAGAAPAVAAVPLQEQAAAAPAGGASLRERALARARQQHGDGDDDLSALVAMPDDAPVPRALPLAKGNKLLAAFTEHFIAPLRPRQVARWARRHGLPLAAAPAGAALRRVLVDPALVDKAAATHAAPVTLYVLTAAIELGRRRSRVLLGSGAQAAVLGRRLWSLPRLGAALAAPLLLGGLVVGFALQPGGGAAQVDDVAAAAAAAAASAAVLAAAAPAPAAVPASAPESSADVADHHAAEPPAVDHTAGPQVVAVALTAAPAEADHGAPPATAAAHADTPAAAVAHAPGVQPATPAASAAVNTPPLDVEPTRGVIALPRLGRVVVKDTQPGDAAAAKAPKLARPDEQARPGKPDEPAPSGHDTAPPPAAPKHGVPPAPAPAPAPAPPPVPATARATARASTSRPAAPTATATAAPGPRAGAFAVSTRPLRTRAEAEQVLAAMTALLRSVGAAGVQVEILPQGPDWRVVGWPYLREGEADKARALLAARGMRVAVVGF